MATAVPIHGVHARLYVNGYDASTAMQNLETSAENEVANATGLAATASAVVVDPAVRASFSASGMFDANQTAAAENRSAHTKLRDAMGLATAVICHMIRDTTLGDIGVGMLANATKYSAKSPHSEVTAASFEAVGNVGLEGIRSLHPMGVETAAGTSTGLDHGASSANGGAGYFQVPAVTGTSITPLIQHSSDSTDGVDGVWVDLLTSAAVSPANVTAGTAHFSRVAVAGTVERWTRAKWTGTFNPATFFIGFNRK